MNGCVFLREMILYTACRTALLLRTSNVYTYTNNDISILDSFMYTCYRMCTYKTFLGIVLNIDSLIVADKVGKNYCIVKHTRQRDWSKIPAENVTGQNLKFMHLTATVAVVWSTVAVEKEAEKEE